MLFSGQPHENRAAASRNHPPTEEPRPDPENTRPTANPIRLWSREWHKLDSRADKTALVMSTLMVPVLIFSLIATYYGWFH